MKRRDERVNDEEPLEGQAERAGSSRIGERSKSEEDGTRAVLNAACLGQLF